MMKKRLSLVILVAFSLTLIISLSACSGQSRDVVVEEQKQENVDPQTKALREQMLKMMQQSREMKPTVNGGQPQQPMQNQDN